MRLSDRSYPHPVLGNADDVPGKAFQSTIEMDCDATNFYFHLEIESSSNTINELLENEKASLYVHFECGNTFFRKLTKLKQLKDNIVPISRDDLNEEVEVNVFVLSEVDISDYYIDGVNPDYGDTKFNISKGDTLAKNGCFVFPIENNFNTFTGVGSFIRIVPTDSKSNFPILTDVGGDKILIKVSTDDALIYSSYKKHPAYSNILSTAIVLPVLAEQIQYIIEENIDFENDGRKWVKFVGRKIQAFQGDGTLTPLTLAQLILDIPLQRSLISIKEFEQNN